MQNQNVIKIALIVLIIFGLGAIVFLFLNKNSAPGLPPNSYLLTLNDNNGSLTGEITENGKVTQLSTEALGQYTLASFNNPHDILTIQCKDGYELSDLTSPSGNKVGMDIVLKAALTEIIPTKLNTVSFLCTKK